MVFARTARELSCRRSVATMFSASGPPNIVMLMDNATRVASAMCLTTVLLEVAQSVSVKNTRIASNRTAIVIFIINATRVLIVLFTKMQLTLSVQLALLSGVKIKVAAMNLNIATCITIATLVKTAYRTMIQLPAHALLRAPRIHLRSHFVRATQRVAQENTVTLPCGAGHVTYARATWMLWMACAPCAPRARPPLRHAQPTPTAPARANIVTIQTVAINVVPAKLTMILLMGIAPRVCVSGTRTAALENIATNPMIAFQLKSAGNLMIQLPVCALQCPQQHHRRVAPAPHRRIA